MLELVGELEPAGIIGVDVEIGEAFVHAAELGGEHLLNLIVVEGGEDFFDPGGELDFDVEGGAVSSEAVGVAQSGEELVFDIPGGPEAVEVEAAGANLTLAQILEADLAVDAFCVHERADVAVFLRSLDLLQFGDEVVNPLLEAYVAGGCVHHADGGEVMACDVSGELATGAVPAAVALCLRVEPGTLAKKGEHALRLKVEKILGVEVLRLLQWTAGQAHIVQRQRDSLDLNFWRK